VPAQALGSGLNYAVEACRCVLGIRGVDVVRCRPAGTFDVKGLAQVLKRTLDGMPKVCAPANKETNWPREPQREVPFSGSDSAGRCEAVFFWGAFAFQRGEAAHKN
jgi:hypothetical protein